MATVGQLSVSQTERFKAEAISKELRKTAQQLRDGELECEPLEEAKIFETIADEFEAMIPYLREPITNINHFPQ